MAKLIDKSQTVNNHLASKTNYFIYQPIDNKDSTEALYDLSESAQYQLTMLDLLSNLPAGKQNQLIDYLSNSANLLDRFVLADYQKKPRPQQNNDGFQQLIIPKLSNGIKAAQNVVNQLLSRN